MFSSSRVGRSKVHGWETDRLSSFRKSSNIYSMHPTYVLSRRFWKLPYHSVLASDVDVVFSPTTNVLQTMKNLSAHKVTFAASPEYKVVQ